MNNQLIQDIGGGVVFTAKVIPGSSKTAVCGLLNGMLKIKVSAPAERGKANKCLVEFLAEKLGVKKSTISVISGQTNPVKQVQVLGISTGALLKKLNLNESRD